MKKMITILSAVAVFALIYYCIRYVQAPVSTVTANTITREEVIKGEAYIVRDEKIYQASMSGTVYSYAKEGARVGNNRKVAAVFGEGVDENILHELSVVNEKISELSSVVSNNSYTSASGSKEERLLQLYERIENAKTENDISEISKCKEEITTILSGSESTSDTARLAELMAEKTRLESQITGAKQDIYTNVSGIYSAKIDGYEEVLTSSSIKGITVEGFLKIQPLATDGANIKVCKIINNHEWYVMALVKRDEIENIKAGDEVGVRFSKLPGEETKAKVEYISQDPKEEEKAVLVLKCESFSEGAFSIRTSSVEIIRKSYTGFEVPVHAIRVQEGVSGVMVRTGSGDDFKPCKMIYKDEEKGTAIIVADTEDVNKELRQYDMIIVGEK